MMLTIAIPTYNRNHLLSDSLMFLLPQFTSECRLLIVDNCSDVPVADTLQAVLPHFPAVHYEIIRNRTNIGGNANILRCFELCDTAWIWVLSDDDIVLPTAIATIFRHITMHPDCLLLNFSYDHLRTQSVTTRGIDDLVENIDPSDDLPWVSTSVFQAGRMLQHLKFGYQYTYSMLPHVATLLVSLADSGMCYLSKEQVLGKRRDAPLGEQWSQINFALGFPTLLDLPLKPTVREGLAKKLLLTNDSEGIILRGLVYQLLLVALRERDHRSVLYYYDQVCSRRYYFDSGIQRKVQLLGYRLVLRFPKATALLYKVVKRKALGGYYFQDRHERM